jgi:hypothetical protein
MLQAGLRASLSGRLVRARGLFHGFVRANQVRFEVEIDGGFHFDLPICW